MSNPEAVSISNLNFDFGAKPILTNLSLNLGKGSRCLLVGANGAGKSTLLRIIAGKNLTKSPVLAFGRNVFTDAMNGITYLGTEWANNPVGKTCRITVS